MSGETLPLDLKKVLRERMLSLLQGKSAPDQVTEPSVSNSPTANVNSGKGCELQTAFSTFLDQKRKQITDNTVTISTEAVSSHFSEVSKITSPEGGVPEPPLNPRTDDAPVQHTKSEMPTDQKTAETSSSSNAHEVKSNQHSQEKSSNANDTKDNHNNKDKKASKKVKATDQARKKTSSSKKRAKNASSHSPTKSRKDEKRRSHSRESHHSRHSSKDKKHKENKTQEHKNKKRPRSPSSTSKNHSHHQSSEKSDRRKRKSLRDSFRSGGTIFDEMNVDANELEKFVEDLVGSKKPEKYGPPPGASSGNSYTCTFKRHPSPPPRRPALSRRHHLDVIKYFSQSSETSKKTSKASTSKSQSTSSNMPGTVHNNGKKTLKELTDFCRKIAEQNKSEKKRHRSADDRGSDSDSDTNEDGAVEKKRSAIRMNIRDAKELKVKDAREQLKAMYPVSTGLDHMCRERDSSKLSPEQINPAFHHLIQRRLDAVKVLSQNPDDYNALLTIEECDAKISTWATTPNCVLDAHLTTPKPSTSTATPQQPLPVEGPQLPPLPYANVPPEAIQFSHLHWARPDYLHMLARSKLGIGKKLLERLGWREGLGLGKDLAGNKEPILPDVKLDRKGLSSETEMLQQHPVIAKAVAANGKHPVSMLQELSSQNRWGAPNFEVTETLGPPHRQSFVMSVTLNGVTYRPTSACPTKKEAKALAATLCLQSLGLWRGDASKQK